MGFMGSREGLWGIFGYAITKIFCRILKHIIRAIACRNDIVAKNEKFFIDNQKSVIFN
jgi:hypothetical protein